MSRRPTTSRMESQDSVYGRLENPSRNPRKRPFSEEDYETDFDLDSYTSEYVASAWETKNKWWEIDDPLESMMAEFKLKPLSHHLYKVEPPRYFKNPEFVEYDACACPIAHLHHYKKKMILWNSWDETMCKVFQASLGSSASSFWFSTLLHGSIRKWSQLMTGFVLKFKVNMVFCIIDDCVCKNMDLDENWKAPNTVFSNDNMPSETDSGCVESTRNIKMKWWEIHDQVKRALAMLMANPLSDHIYRSCHPRYFNVPDFVPYDGNTCPVAHLNHYQHKMMPWNNSELLCKVFYASLGSVALVWFYTLSDGSIVDWTQLMTAFIVRFKINHSRCSTVDCTCRW